MKQIFNPYLPCYEYIPDAEPYIFNGRLYIYGSHDKFNGTDYCQNDYVCWSAPVDDLSDWRFEGEIYNRNQHPYKEERMLLFAPDVARGVDGRYYLYYSMAHSSRISVAVCDEPAGRYEYLGDVKTLSGGAYGLHSGDFFQFDPAVFVDDDNQVYLYSGFCPKDYYDEQGRIMLGAHVCRLSSDMLTISDLPKLIIPRDFECPEGAGFFEASSMRKFNDKYYFIYSAKSNGLHYATSSYPDRDFTYGGRLHSTADVGLRGYTPKDCSYPNGNTHGSILLLNDKYYIFDHRFTNRTSYSRQGVAEPIYMDEAGHFSQAEATSCGLYGKALKAEGEYPAYIACFIKNLSLNSTATREEKLGLTPFITQDGNDREGGSIQYITNICSNSMCGFKYFDFSECENGVVSGNNVNLTLTLSVRGNANGKIYITTDTDMAGKKRTDYSIVGEAIVEIDSPDRININIPVTISRCVKPLYLIFEGTGSFDLISLAM